VESEPWKAVPHLHPRLAEDQRVSAQEDALFLEYAIALEPGVALAYLSSEAIPEGCYRFGGEGHLVQLRCHPVPVRLQQLLQDPDGFGPDQPIALITPGLWGSRKLSLREPLDGSRAPAFHPWRAEKQGPGILTERPRPWRFRLGGGSEGKRRLSRGRWCMPAGSCYGLPEGLNLPPWAEWPESWFPREGFSLRQFGTALALPLYGVPSG
jgi:CRISPR-associated protein Cmr3